MSATQIQPTTSRLWADRLGTWASLLCVVHCIVTPVLVSSSVVLAHFLPAEEHFHRTLSLAVALLGAVALITGFRAHRRLRVLTLMAAGLLCVAGAAWFGGELPSHAWEVSITLAGSALMISAHRLNHTFCAGCACADTTAIR